MNKFTLVSTKWLAQKLCTESTDKLRVLDCSWHLSRMQRDPKREFLEKHIPKAQFFGIAECCDLSSRYKLMLPTPQSFEDYIGKLGISNETHVVVYDSNKPAEVMSAPRVWWTFRVFGHEHVYILDGGLPKWESDGYQVTNAIENGKVKKFKATFNPNLVKNFDDMMNNVMEKKFIVIDSRSPETFRGELEPQAGSKSGHSPDALNIPYSSIWDTDTKVMKSPEILKSLFKEKGVNFEEDISLVSSCGGGISACTLALAASLCGRHDVAVYDGSWSEWSRRAPDYYIVTDTS